jgi:hypothetical protein
VGLSNFDGGGWGPDRPRGSGQGGRGRGRERWGRDFGDPEGAVRRAVSGLRWTKRGEG